MTSDVNSLVTIIIPTYNYGSFVTRALDSALNQTYPNIEIVVVDDGSTDDTLARLSAYGNKIHVITQDNQGASAARNRGIEEASGDYIAFLDADDCYLPENIAKKVDCLHQKQGRFLWCYSNCVWVDNWGHPSQRGDEIKSMLLHQKAQGDVFLQALSGALLGSNLFLFHRDVLAFVGGFDTKLKVLEDYDLYVRAAAKFPLAYVDEVLVEIHAHEGSLSHGGKRQGYLSRWRLNHKHARSYPQAIGKIGNIWRKNQADVYRNLAAFSLEKGNAKRAKTLLLTSLEYQCWQPGAIPLGLKILLA
ncbi:MAG: hypothetical protein AUK35_02270 [Zetaproteobacteria bacterium CG2_30_46_52]|nr:MAG: hypothetical protein AUK35_02270 [Zetaproteobacteria bacterium CG2_30_46_52]